MEGYALKAIYGEWEIVARTKTSRRVVEQLASIEPSIRALAVRDLADLVETTSGSRGSIDEETVHETLGALVRQFDHDPLVGMTLVRAMLPGLSGVAVRMRWGAGGPWHDRAEFEADLVSSAWSHLRVQAGETLERPCRTIVEKVRRSLRTERERHQRHASLTRPISAIKREPVMVGPDHLTELGRALVALADSAIARSDAALLFTNRVLGYPLSAIAAESGVSIASLSYRRRCAEAAVSR